MKSHPRDTQEMKNLLREHTCHPQSHESINESSATWR
jgi:hypothetical protein